MTAPKKKGRPGRKAGATTTKKRKRLRTACGCDRLYRFAAGCGALARLAALVRSARAGDCQFDRRCPRARDCPVAAQTLYKPRSLMIRAVRMATQIPPVSIDCTNWGDVWY